MTLNDTIARVTERIVTRSKGPRGEYLDRMNAARQKGPARAHLSCSGQAHAYAGAGPDQGALAQESAGNSKSAARTNLNRPTQPFLLC